MPRILKLFLPALCLLFCLHANAQVSCAGSLGDPVINEDFGSGPVQPLPSSVTNLRYTTDCPGDEELYTILSALTPYNNCRRETWHNVLHDHTGNPNGNMMLINASSDPSVFFTQKASGLCPNTTYFFSAYVLNVLMKSAAVDPSFVEPNIAFSVETTSGQVLATDTTGIIQPTDTAQWNQYGVFFTTPANSGEIVVKMNNLTIGSNGNDLILD